MDRVRLILVPIEFGTQAHIEELQRQRRICGWGDEDIPLWKAAVEQGHRVMFWIATSEPVERAELSETVTTLRDTQSREIFPIGHIAVERKRMEDPGHFASKEFVPSSARLESLFVLPSFQRIGAASFAILEMERIAIEEPINVEWMTIVGMSAEQFNDDNFWKRNGKERPRFSMEDYYRRRGYVTYETGPAWQNWDIKEEKLFWVNAAFMKKKLK
ncbi:hypothetical protein BT69DRAFT_1350154 [Atractiella rhizophila]|nr:hypothetical protein BT69DRAFT_1350154 [Atractiella rhizophila]